MIALKEKPKNSMLTRNNGRISNKTILLLMAIPCIAMLLIFFYLPLAGWSLSFFNYKPGIPLFKSPFVGLKYFKMIFSEPDLFDVLRNTLVLSFIGLATTPLPVLFAILLSEMQSKKYQKVVQTFTTLPNFISWIIVYGVFYAMFTTDDGGLVNSILLNLGIIREPYNIFGDPNAVWGFQTFISIWKGLGFGAIIYLAAISGIDSELFDAAAIDGAGRWQKILHITLPGLTPTYVTMLLLNIGGLLSNGFDQYFNFYNSLVHTKIQVLDLYLYRVGIVMNSFSFSTALGIMKTLVSILLLIMANSIVKKVRGSAIF